MTRLRLRRFDKGASFSGYARGARRAGLVRPFGVLGIQIQSQVCRQRRLMAQSGRSPLAEQVLLAFIEMGFGYVRVSDEVTGELNRSA
jgi:hypothetical protein